MGARPDLKFAAKNKSTRERVFWGAAWRNERGQISLRLDKGFKLVGPHGEFTNETEFFDVYENDSRPRPADAAFDFGDDDIPAR